MLATVHRPGNTDIKENLLNIINALEESGERIIFPIHPRTDKSLKTYKIKKDIKGKNILFAKPLSYIEMLQLEKEAKKIVTDSGGVQKEAYFFGVPCITLRESTEWVETVEDSWNILVGTDKKKIINAIKFFRPDKKKKETYGNGRASLSIVNIIKRLMKKKFANFDKL